MPVSTATGAGHTASVANLSAIAVGTAPVALVIVVGILLSGHVPETAFLVLAVAVGLPHGALDHLVGKSAFNARYGVFWWRPFLTGYLALIVATLLIWRVLPSVALLGFLGLSLFHFGEEDALGDAPGRLVRIAAHGGAVIIVPAVWHLATVEPLFAMLAPAHAHALKVLLSQPLAALWGSTALTTLIIHAVRGEERDWSAAINLVLVVLLFVVVTPLVAFSLYFAAIHTPRALATTLPVHRRRGATMLIPAVLTLLGLALGAAIFLEGSGEAVSENIVRSTFLLLSALTVPHMWLEWRARRTASDCLSPNS